MVKKRIILKNNRPNETVNESKLDENTVNSTARNNTDSIGNADLNNLIRELRVQNDYLSKIDWKLWKIMNMVSAVCEENGYDFKETRS